MIISESIYFENVTVNRLLLYKCILFKCKLYFKNVQINDYVQIKSYVGVLCKEIIYNISQPDYIDNLLI